MPARGRVVSEDMQTLLVALSDTLSHEVVRWECRDVKEARQKISNLCYYLNRKGKFTNLGYAQRKNVIFCWRKDTDEEPEFKSEEEYISAQ